MNAKLLERLRQVTEEEKALLAGDGTVERARYTSRREFVVDSAKLLEKGKLIEVRPHTRFVHFPRHRHNYVELIYMCSGSTTHIVNGADTVTLETGDLLFLNQAVYHEIPARRARRCGGQLYHPAPVFRPQLCHAGAGKRPV